MKVLGIETSCDDTAAAVYDSAGGLRGHRQASQLDSHRPFGGVVPELAARDHVRLLMPLVRQVLADTDLKVDDLDGVAYTSGPGLAGALLVGAALGRSLAWSLDIPAAGIHHMEGHLLAPMLEAGPPEFPFLALLVSGGHTMLVDVRAVGRYQLLGSTRDDAVGEAFDKTAKLLGLDYPGGPAVAAAAKSGRPGQFHFPRPMTDRPGLDFSFSGLKTFCPQHGSTVRTQPAGHCRYCVGVSGCRRGYAGDQVHPRNADFRTGTSGRCGWCGGKSGASRAAQYDGRRARLPGLLSPAGVLYG